MEGEVVSVKLQDSSSLLPLLSIRWHPFLFREETGGSTLVSVPYLSLLPTPQNPLPNPVRPARIVWILPAAAESVAPDILPARPHTLAFPGVDADQLASALALRFRQVGAAEWLVMFGVGRVGSLGAGVGCLAEFPHSLEAPGGLGRCLLHSVSSGTDGPLRPFLSGRLLTLDNMGRGL